MSKRAAIYVRVSTGQQEEDGTSLGSQELQCRRYATEHGYTVDEVHIYREVHTGTELWERPKLTALRNAVRRHETDTVIAYAIDRLSRDPVHLGVVLSEADHARVEVEFVTEPLDNTPEGQLIRFVRGYAAKVEHEKIRERSVRGKRARVESGRLLAGSRPLFGYHWRDDTHSALAIDEVTAPVVQRIYREYRDGHSLRAIAAGLMQDHIPTPTRKRDLWNTSTVKKILTHPGYCGRAFGWGWSGTQGWGFNYERAIALPEGTIPPLVDADMWDTIQEQFRRNREQSIRKCRFPEAALLRGGYVRCGYCGKVMQGHRLGTSNANYRCITRYSQPGVCKVHVIAVKLLDRAVWQKIEDILMRPEIIAAEVAKLRSEDPTLADLAAVERDQAKVQRQQNNVTRAIALLDSDDPDAAAPLVAELSTLSKRKLQLEAEREKILQRHETWIAAQERLESLEAWCMDVAARLRGFTYQEKRLALEALGVAVRVYDTSHDPRYVIEAHIPLDEEVFKCTKSRC